MGRLLYIGFASAYAEGDIQSAFDWAQEAADYPMPRRQLIQFLYRLAEVYMVLGDPGQASQQILRLVGQGPRPEHYMDPAVIDQSFRIYRGVRDAGHWADAIEFIRLYTQSIPESIRPLQIEYQDSITVFSTRHKLGEGFQHWRNASYGQVVNFFEGKLTEGGLTKEQAVVARQVLACAYFAFGRRVEAEDTFREIFGVRPHCSQSVGPGCFAIETEVPRLQQLYGLSIYNPETRRFFGGMRPGQ